MNSMTLIIPLHFISWKKTLDGAVTPQRQSQFTPKMKANAVSRLLSSLVWIDHYNQCNWSTALIIFANFRKCNRMTSFMEFMIYRFIDFRLIGWQQWAMPQTPSILQYAVIQWIRLIANLWIYVSPLLYESEEIELYGLCYNCQS